MLRGRQVMRDTEIDQASFLAPCDHLDRKAEGFACFAQERGRVLRNAQSVGADRAHCLARKALQPLSEATQRLERTRLRRTVDALIGGEPRADTHHLAQHIERIDLAVDHPTDLQMKAVRAEVDRGERFVLRHPSRDCRDSRACGQ